MHIAALVLEGILGVFSVYTAYSLFAGTPASIAKQREALHFPHWYWVLAGCVASIGAIGLLAGLAIPEIGALAAIWGCAYFVVATLTHLVRKDVANLAAPLVFLAFFVALTALRWGDVSSAIHPVVALLPVK